MVKLLVTNTWSFSIKYVIIQFSGQFSRHEEVNPRSLIINIEKPLYDVINIEQ